MLIPKFKEISGAEVLYIKEKGLNYRNTEMNHPSSNHNELSQSSNPAPEVYQRRESLVKPTWHNVFPGQVPADTLQKLNKMGNGGHHETYTNTGSNNNQINALITGGGSAAGQRQEEPFDLFGKVTNYS